MNDWTSDAPTFAVVGKTNMGKSSVLSTLLEIDNDAILRVSDTPGETTRCQALPLEFDGKEQLRFVDTPGFQRAQDAMRHIQAMHGEGSPNLETLRRFVAEQKDQGELVDEALLLEPIVEGAGLLYVIDPSKPIRDDFIAEMEIMRWTGRPRMALLNEKGENEERLAEWKARLGSYFNLVRTFNAHRARFEERRRLLKSLLEIDEEHRARIENTISLIDEEWVQRREESAEILMDFLSRAMSHRESVQLDEKEEELEHRKERKKEELTKNYYASIGKFEKKAYQKLLKVYRHKLLKVDLSDEHFTGVDLSSEETWQKWGLSRSQITIAGGVAGGVAGAAVDLGSAGLTHGLGTLFGALGGAAGAFFKGDSLPELKVDAGGVSLAGQSSKALYVGPPENDNFAWILLDRFLHHYREIISRSHGRRDEALVERQEKDAGFVRGLTRDRRNKIHRWISQQTKTEEANFDAGVFHEMVEIFREIEKT